RLRRGARPATAAEAGAARTTVVTVSLSCAGQKGCLPRSLATVMLCRMRGQWPTWCVGVRTRPPFAAHAWVEAEGILVGEDCPRTYFQRLITVE
ncbi:lasso peptide biosynthesis B2 protein, partial [Streptomyces spectabilis]|uniref:lasso peptide biosynthesis B2 protein n=1 Tax=Streptomyces spectabilis TaxID=68270 RepID=UPI0033E5050F